ncbi:Flavoredoxin [compost metagenome]
MEKVKVDYKKMYYGFPVILISFYDEKGNPGITPISSSYSLKDMVMLGFNSGGYAINQIKKTKDFVINIPSRSLEEQVVAAGSLSGADHNKLENVNLTLEQAESVNAPIIKECPIAIECTLSEVIESEQFAGITNVLAAVKDRWVAPDYIDEQGLLVAGKYHPILNVSDGTKRTFRYIEG